MRRAGRFFAKGMLLLLAAAVLGFMVMLLWNAVVPALFAGAHAIDYWHALGLLILSRILFGGFRGHGHHGWRHRFENGSSRRQDLGDFLKFAARQQGWDHDGEL